MVIMRNDTTIRLKIQTRDKLNALKTHKRQPSDEIINSLMENFRRNVRKM